MATVYTDCDEMLLLPDKFQERQKKIYAWPFSIISLILKINGCLCWCLVSHNSNLLFSGNFSTNFKKAKRRNEVHNGLKS